MVGGVYGLGQTESGCDVELENGAAMWRRLSDLRGAVLGFCAGEDIHNFLSCSFVSSDALRWRK